MARAKRTDRAEARRKYRAYLQAEEDGAAAESQESGGQAPAATSRSTRGDQRNQSTAQPVVRVGLLAAARAAYQRPTYIDDLRNIGSLVFRSNAVWPVLAVCIAAGAYLTTTVTRSGGTTDATFAPLLFQFIFWPVPLLPPMLAGFLAPRATWLAGALAGLIATTTLLVVFAIVGVSLSNASSNLAAASASPSAAGPTAVASAAASATALLTTSPGSSSSTASAAAPTATPAASPSGTTGTTGATTSDVTFGVLILLLQAMTFGALMGALSGWYKRFLSLTSGPRKNPPSRGNQRQQRRPARR